MTEAKIVDQMADWRWRLSNLYWIVNEKGDLVPFRPYPAQLDIIAKLTGWDLIVKARQLGFSTVVDILGLDQTVFLPSYNGVIIAHELGAVGRIFDTKVKRPYSKLPDAVRAANYAVASSTSELRIRHEGAGNAEATDSVIYVATSGRSGTHQFVHVSEMGKIARRYPERAREIISGTFPTVHEGSLCIVESTAEGAGGEFYQMVQEAQKLEQLGRKPRHGEFTLHFYPWWKDEKYVDDPTGIVITADMEKYFAEVEAETGITLTPAQRAWYVIKSGQQRGLMKQEYPSTIKEAFSGALEERYFSEAMRVVRAEKRIKVLPFQPGSPVNLFLDIGRDRIATWVHQYLVNEHRMVGYWEMQGVLMDTWALAAQQRGLRVKQVYLPHDGEDKSVVTDKTARAVVQAAFPNAKVRLVPRVNRKFIAIDAARKRLYETWFHEANTALGVDRLDNYRKKWMPSLSNWSDEPLHDEASHGASAFETFALGWEPTHEQVDSTLGVFPGLATRAGAYQ